MNITSQNSDSRPRYRFFVPSFFFPVDSFVIMVSGLSALLYMSGAIGMILRRRK